MLRWTNAADGDAMNKLDLGPIGMTVQITADGRHLAEAAALERLGYSAIWLRGGQIDNLSRIAEVVEATTAVPVVPGIIPVDVYPPAEVIKLYADLQTRAPGRFVAGLGGPQVPRPLRPLNEYLDQLDQSEPPVPPSRRILAALGPRKLELARDRAAGAVLLLVTPDYTRTARSILGPQATLVVSQMAVLGTNTDRAREAARGPLRFLSGVAGYQASFSRMGFTAGDIASLSNELVDQLVAWGSASAISARIDEYRQAGADQVALTLLDSGYDAIDSARQLSRRLLNERSLASVMRGTLRNSVLRQRSTADRASITRVHCGMEYVSTLSLDNSTP
jgi:probable F420-dependent oxidoreductase